MNKAISLLLALVMCLSLCACGSSEQKDTAPATSQPNNDIIEFEDILVADDINVTIELVNFYVEQVNWVSSNQAEKLVTFRFTNKTDQELILNPDNFYLNNEKMFVLSMDGGVSLESGRSGKYSFMVAEDTSPEHTALKSLENLYNLEGSFSGVIDYGDPYKSKSLDVSFSIPKAINGEVSAIAAPNLEQYGEVVAALTKDTWYFNGGADSVMNSITFSDSSATIAQISYDGNRKHEGAVNTYAYTLDDNAITVTLADGSPLAIPYILSGDDVILDGGSYLTPDDIIAGLQGFWTLDDNITFGHSIYYVCIIGDTITSESASAALNAAPGSYYWYGGDGYSASFQLNFGGFDTSMMHGDDWFFNVIDGNAVLLHFDRMCSRTDITKLPGKNGYSFD